MRERGRKGEAGYRVAMARLHCLDRRAGRTMRGRTRDQPNLKAQWVLVSGWRRTATASDGALLADPDIRVALTT